MPNGQGRHGVAMAPTSSPRWHEKFTSSLREHILVLTNVSFAKDRPCSSCIAGKLHEKAHKVKPIITTLRPLELIHLDLFGPPTYDSWEGGGIALLLLMTSQDILGCSFSRPKMKLKKTSSTLQKKLIVNIIVRSRQFKVTMALSSRTT